MSGANPVHARVSNVFDNMDCDWVNLPPQLVGNSW